MQRHYMIDYRKKHNLSIKQMAERCNTSATILSLLEECDQEITHPNIAERIGMQYYLTNEQIESLMPEHYRKSSPNYDPDLYRRNVDELKQINILPRRYQ